MKEVSHEIGLVAAHFRATVDWNWRRIGAVRYVAKQIPDDIVRAINWVVLTPIVQEVYDANRV
jgi:hypothetical protein